MAVDCSNPNTNNASYNTRHNTSKVIVLMSSTINSSFTASWIAATTLKTVDVDSSHKCEQVQNRTTITNPFVFTPIFALTRILTSSSANLI